MGLEKITDLLSGMFKEKGSEQASPLDGLDERNREILGAYVQIKAASEFDQGTFTDLAKKYESGEDMPVLNGVLSAENRQKVSAKEIDSFISGLDAEQLAEVDRMVEMSMQGQESIFHSKVEHNKVELA